MDLMTNTAELTHLDESILEDECKCEVNHVVTTCSYQVTHLHRTCEWAQLCCWNATAAIFETEEWKTRHEFSCTECGRAGEDCWTIRPV